MIRRPFRQFRRFLVSLSITVVILVGWNLYHRLTAPPPDGGMQSAEIASTFHPSFSWPSPLELATVPRAVRFDHPVGSESGALTFNARRFSESEGGHGDVFPGVALDWIGGGVPDGGHVVRASADGKVVFSGFGEPGGSIPGDGDSDAVVADTGRGTGRGKAVVLAHRVDGGRVIQSLYGQLRTVDVAFGEPVRRGQIIGRSARSDPPYLRFEIRDSLPAAPGASQSTSQGALDRIDPSEFLRNHRGAPSTKVLNAPIGSPPDDAAPEPQSEVQIVPEDAGKPHGSH